MNKLAELLVLEIGNDRVRMNIRIQFVDHLLKWVTGEPVAHFLQSSTLLQLGRRDGWMM